MSDTHTEINERPGAERSTIQAPCGVILPPPTQPSLLQAESQASQPLVNMAMNSLPLGVGMRQPPAGAMSTMPLAVGNAHTMPSVGIAGAMAPIPGVIPDEQLRPAHLTMEELQRELTARGIVYSDSDKVINVGKLTGYLIDMKRGESDLSSDSEGAADDLPAGGRASQGSLDLGGNAVASESVFAFLEVLLVSYGQQKKPLLDWLANWKRSAEDMNRVEITELEESSLIKIRVWNNTSEPSGLVEQLNSVNIKCARYYCYTRGSVWGGWEFYEHGQLQKQEGYNAENQPPMFWKRLCWIENADVDLSEFDKYQSVVGYPAKAISKMFGTDEDMICSNCANVEEICSRVHGTFKGYFESKDLFDRHMSVIQ